MIIRFNGKTIPRMNFNRSMEDINTLLALFDERSKKGKGHNYHNYEVLKRSSIILLVTAWESYVEDSIHMAFEHILSNAKDPETIKSAANALSISWADKLRSKRVRDIELLNWTGSRWKDLLKEMCKKDIQHLNTPNYENLESLFQKYFGRSVFSVWRIRGYSPTQIRKGLDNLIEYRGSLVHSSKQALLSPPGVPRFKLVAYMKLIVGLVESTERYFMNDFNNNVPT